MLICPCKRTKVIMLVTIETLIRKQDLVVSIMECKKTTLSCVKITEASMLTKVTLISMDNNILISSLKRAGGKTINKMAVGSTATLNKTSTEGILQMGLMQYTHQPRIKR